MKKRRRGRRVRAESFHALMLPEKPYKDLLALWMLKAVVKTPIQQKFFKKGGFDDESVMCVVGLEGVDLYDTTKRELNVLFKKQLSRLEKKGVSKKSTLVKNIEALGKTLLLNPCERDILTIAVIADTEQIFQEIFEHLGEISMPVLKQVLGVLLGYSSATIQEALNKDSVLVSSGFLRVSDGMENFNYKLEVLEGLSEMLYQENIQPDEIFGNFFSTSDPPELALERFPHIKTDIRLLSAFLKATLKEKVKGVNVLIYGLPGTGKTQFVKSLSKSLNMGLYEINVEDSDGDPLSGQSRFSAYRLCQKILSNSSELILFDEIEDVFPDTTFGLISSQKEVNKGWTNRILETNPNPAFWLCNSIDQIDTAYKRRFDYVMEMKIPPMSVREQIIREALKGVGIDNNWIRQLAENEKISPALVRQSADVTRLIKSEKTVNPEQTLKHIINSKLDLMGISKKVNMESSDFIEYNLEYLNSDTDLIKLVEGVRRTCRGRICLYGHSGTGKTAFAHYLAKCVGKPLIQKRASDLLGRYVGETEHCIALMFEQGKDEDGVLLLDEADSFLRDRQLSSNSWEVTMVNEILVHLEQYQGLFICSTNLMDNLDKASLRRFDFKVSFDYLTPAQSWKLFQHVLGEFGKQIEKKDRSKLKRQIQVLDNLTPGDFTLIKRKSIITGNDMSGPVLLEALTEESRIKTGRKKKSIGFGS